MPQSAAAPVSEPRRRTASSSSILPGPSQRAAANSMRMRTRGRVMVLAQSITRNLRAHQPMAMLRAVDRSDTICLNEHIVSRDSAMLKKFALLLVALFASGAAFAADTATKPVTVFGAASLTNVLGELGKAFTAKSGVEVRFSFAASSTLARQIESGAGAELFLSADKEWMDYLEQRALIRKETRVDLLSNR